MAASRDDHTETRDERELEQRTEVAAETMGQRGVPLVGQWLSRRTPRTPKPVYPKMSFGVWMRRLGWRHLIAILGVLFALYPVAYIISTSISGTNNLSNASIIPTTIDLSVYRELFSNPSLTPFMTWLPTAGSYRSAQQPSPWPSPQWRRMPSRGSVSVADGSGS